MPARLCGLRAGLLGMFLLGVTASQGRAQPTPGQVLWQQKISNAQPGFPDTLEGDEYFGYSVCALGDLDGDGDTDLAVGAPGNSDGPVSAGAVYVLFMRPDGRVDSHVQIGDGLAGLTGGLLAPGDSFGGALARLGDLDGDGVTELAVGRRNAGSGVWILFLNSDGTVKGEQEISPGQGGYTGLALGSHALAAIPDLDGDGLPELAVGDGSSGQVGGRVRLLFLAGDGTVTSHVVLSGFTLGLPIDMGDKFGDALACIGDIDGDGVPELAVGAPGDDDGAATSWADVGAIWILFLQPDGSVHASQKLSALTGGMPPALADWDQFGRSLALVADASPTRPASLAVGAGSTDETFWLLDIAADGTVLSSEYVASGSVIGAAQVDGFARALAAPGDLDADGIEDLIVGAPFDDDGGEFGSDGIWIANKGAIWLLSLASGPIPDVIQKISSTQGGFDGDTLDVLDRFGSAVVSLGDLNRDGFEDLAIGSPEDDDTAGGSTNGDRGAVWILFLGEGGTVVSWQKISDSQGGMEGALAPDDSFGQSLAVLGDVDGDGVVDHAVGADGDDGAVAEPSYNRGAVWILFLNPDGTVKARQRITEGAGGVTGLLDDGDAFGQAVATIGDVDGDGVVDLVAGATGDDDSTLCCPGAYGAVYVLFLRPDGRVKAHQKISQLDGGLSSTLSWNAHFGSSLASLGDLNGDGIDELAVGARGQGGAGAVFVLTLDSSGAVDAEGEVGAGLGGFAGALAYGDEFGSSLALLEDLDGNGVRDLAVGARSDPEGAIGTVDPCGPYGSCPVPAPVGTVWILFLRANGTVKAHAKVSAAASGGMQGLLEDQDNFGASLSGPFDLDGDGAMELAVGAPDDDDGGWAHGAVWLLRLSSSGTAPWTNLGMGLSGTTGLPALDAQGTLQPLTLVSLDLVNALPGAPIVLFIGGSVLNQGFKGGVLVPQPDVVVAGLATDASGTLLLSGTWPTRVPAGEASYYQYWIADPGGPLGCSASNALVGISP